MRRLRRHSIKLIILVLFCGTGVLYFTKSTEDVDRQSQIQIMERSIRSVMNQVECRLPELPVDNPELDKFFHTVDKIDCGDINQDWVMCEKSICFVKPEAIAANGDITCVYTDIIRKSDFKARYGKSVKTKEPYILQATDFVKVLCTAENGLSWLGMAYGIRDGIENTLIHKPVPPPINNVNPINVLEIHSELPRYFNVLMFGFDSVSRNTFIRKLPKTYEYLTNELQAIILKGYNIVGDGTPQALTPILTGFTELEMPETRKRMSNAVPVDQAYPMIWKDYEKRGYVTSFNEDIPSVGTFTYRLTGFEKQPVHHYLRTYYLEAENILSSSKEHCINHQTTHITMMDYTKNFMAKYSDTPRFVFSFHGGLSHDSINQIEAADDDVVSWLASLKAKQLLENTILIFMSDHGIRFTEIRETLQGKQEERLPFFSFSFPASFKKRFPQEYNNFIRNSERLSTPFDIHATLKHVLEIQTINPTVTSDEQLTTYDILLQQQLNQEPNPNIQISDLAKNRAISLFSTIPENRSCADAYIEPHWCACLNWQQLNVTSNIGILLKAAGSILNVINNATQTFRHYCEALHLKRINWALLLKPHQELLSFKHNLDMDGYLSDLTGNSRSPEVYYQLQILVSPGDSLFEASVSYNLDKLTMNTKLSQISRVNIYGSQANCIYERNPELRKYCYCKQ